jgi:hypothetical protein
MFKVIFLIIYFHTFLCDSTFYNEKISIIVKYFNFFIIISANISLEQFASCYLTCTPTYGKLLETCCKSGLNVVCSNFPWDILKPKLGSCPGTCVSFICFLYVNDYIYCLGRVLCSNVTFLSQYVDFDILLYFINFDYLKLVETEFINDIL